MMTSGQRLLVVSNRLPIVLRRDEDRWQVSAGAGGLVTALAPVIKANKGLWVGWPGCGDEAPVEPLLDQFGEAEGYQLASVPLSQQEVDRFYLGFSNETPWPLFHDMLGQCRFSTENWRSYQQVNRRFAEVVAGRADENDLIWVQDYQLALVGEELRRLGVRQALGYFLHIPFPSPDLLRRLPWKQELLRGLLAYDLIGFQTLRDRRNFVNSANMLLPEVEVIGRRRSHSLLRYGDRVIKAGHFPISIDSREFENRARTHEVDEAAWFLHEKLAGRQLILGIDRLDYTKGLPQRFLAFERALELDPALVGHCSLLQVVVPSRTLVPEYRDLKELLDRESGRINSRFSEAGWVPIHYHYRSLDPVQLLAHYRTCEIALITPLRDGMNLVAKEYCACSLDNNGVLILSEFAGAADQMGNAALLVNPYDVDGTAEAICHAFHMPLEERQQRMRRLRGDLRRNDVHRWVGQFLKALRGHMHG
ncbi:alpha,alpha-trehalose-phosphate synthase (UDP-forming) [Geothermobacter hydrogeniphilus]|uniref:Trehalose-6-phosphate synthase n=1 Tax=Geothermobacter hydrogeniphilus TaxID=1969733 RepID=A0A1X0YAD1_9BACT|nr:trehalose-6-phosphate synthase [Geothermobacter hydrogeniphilus]ORJ62043.1 trehalose-6-phosphate synthase [Geothermobacter hydrogeniphilus]